MRSHTCSRAFTYLLTHFDILLARYLKFLLFCSIEKIVSCNDSAFRTLTVLSRAFHRWALQSLWCHRARGCLWCERAWVSACVEAMSVLGCACTSVKASGSAMHMYMCTHICTYPHTSNAYVYEYTLTYTHVCTHTRMHTHAFTLFKHTHTHVFIAYVHTHTYILYIYTSL